MQPSVLETANVLGAVGIAFAHHEADVRQVHQAHASIQRQPSQLQVTETHRQLADAEWPAVARAGGR